MLPTIIVSPLFQLLALSALSLFARVVLMRQNPSATASGAIVMAIGIFALGALQRLEVRGLADVQLLRRVLGGAIGIKVAGNIHTWAGAGCFLMAGATRVACRRGVEIAGGFIASHTLDSAE